MSFAFNLKEARENKGLTKTDMARFLGVSLTAYSLYEKGEREPPLKNLKKISRMLGVPLDWLVEDTIDNNEEAFEIASFFWKELYFVVSKSNGIVKLNSEYLSKPLEFKEDEFINRSIDFFDKLGYLTGNEDLWEFILFCFKGLDKNLVIE